MTTIISDRFACRRRTAASWTSLNEVLYKGEIGLESDTGKFKFGDGTSAWNSIGYANGAGGIATAIHAATGKTTPVDADEMGLVDSAASFGLRKLTWANLKATLKTYFDTLYASAAGSPVTLLGTATVAGSAATTLTLSSLNLGAYKSFLIIFALDNATASASNISLYYNSDTTATNYYRQAITSTGGAVSGARVNEGLIISLVASETATGDMKVYKDRDGKARARVMTNIGAPSSMILQDFAHAWTSATNVTGITLSASVANSLAIGSTFTVYGIN